MTKSYGKIFVVILIIELITATSSGHTQDVSVQHLTIDTISNPIPSEVVWSENFDDENIDDWEIFGVNSTTDPGYLIPGNFSVTDGVLRSVGPEWNFAAYNISIAYGTWSFDIDIQRPEEIDRFAVAFIGEKFGDHWLPASGSTDAYLISFRIFDEGPSGDIRIARNTVTGGTAFLDGYVVDNIRGWKNIIVTREESGQFYVYLNGILILDAVDTVHTTSERFIFLGMANPAIDNITVSDTIDYDKAPPEWTHSIINQELTFGESFYYDMNATDHAGIDHYWLNDTLNFAIDTDGIVTNVRDLEIGDYGIQVNVNDTLGNTRTSTFTLTVEAGSIVIPIEFLIAIVGVTAVVVVVLVIWRTKRR